MGVCVNPGSVSVPGDDDDDDDDDDDEELWLRVFTVVNCTH